MPAMDEAKWNSKYPIGQPVIVTLANGKRIRTETTGAAYHVGQFDMVPVAAIKQGAIPLSWCWPIKNGPPSGE
jgi:hypothetical protein